MEGIKLQSLNQGDEQKLYGQYYTCSEVSRLLVRGIGYQNSVRSVVDLCVGQGALLSAAREFYPAAKLYGYDIDPNNIETINKTNNLSINAYHFDTTSEKFLELLPQKKFDIVLGNPPFGTIKKNTFIDSMLDEFGWNWSSTKIPLELLYIVLGLRLSKHGGILSYVVPDGIITNDKLSNFRKILAEKYRVKKVTSLGCNRFYGTEARTHLLTIENSTPRKKYKIAVDYTERNSKAIQLSKEQFVERGDYIFHTKPSFINAIPLNKLNVKIFRGKSSFKVLLKSNVDVIHTTSFSSEYQEFSNSVCDIDNDRIVSKGDIVIARVGSRVIGRVGLIKAGNFIISDCIIAIRTENQSDRAAILKVLTSYYGNNWLNSVSKGVGAKHITLKSIRELPVHDFENS